MAKNIRRRSKTRFWQDLEVWLATLDTYLPLEKLKILFGIHEESPSSVSNFIILIAKQFIWRTKFGSKNLEIALFQKYFYSKLIDLRNALIYRERLHEFSIWNNIFDFMSVLPACTAETVAHMPTSDIPTADPTD